MFERGIPFKKMNGCGNDFIVVDNRDGLLNEVALSAFVQNVCRRGTSIGADGFMLLENSNIADFKMRYFNADGSEGEMCGNGARCMSRFAHHIGAAETKMSFETMAGIYQAELNQNSVKVKFPDVPLQALKLNQPYEWDGPSGVYHYGVVGVPHTVWFVENVIAIADDQLREWGRMVRNDLQQFPNGTNVNFVERIDRQTLGIRTYERGVETETYACGSGSTAAAIIAGILGQVDTPVNLLTRGGPLKISYQLTDYAAESVYLEGNSKLVAEGHLLPDAWT
ncbi:diaminopimelate epimerase [Brevibacillus sp. HB1.3]|uniref:diaminopimelate epimerase n=1 Tax=Brevibacillus sp. HB1.3 TaxID=2738842 RepID=UPI001551B707|nr:diaminopimelate epimerase [Brevibacillus sp. HB1.3]NQF13054.1 diaminopimelate epimerase [Brevibacillus sp. HB1.3]